MAESHVSAWTRGLHGYWGGGAPAGMGTMSAVSLWGWGQEYGVLVGMESTTHGDTAACISKCVAALAHPLYGTVIFLDP